ncbi:TonB family protein [Paraburkholderia sp.]|uniref:energy transducer TonB n=1 Tax=Paraburkholderia sp. TaxID=1926495 RepID=UPI003D6E9ADE
MNAPLFPSLANDFRLPPGTRGARPRSGCVAALIMAVLLHVAGLIAFERFDAPLALHPAEASSTDSGLRVTLVAAPTQPTQLIAPASGETRSLQPAMRRATTSPPTPVLARHSRRTRRVSSPTPAFTQPSEPQPVLQSASPTGLAPAVTPTSAPSEHALNLPDAPAVRNVARVLCDIGQPSYPPRSRRLGEEGRVVLRVTIDPAGRITQANITASSGFEELDAAARQAMLVGRCEPYVDHGIPITVHALQPLDFRLDN